MVWTLPTLTLVFANTPGDISYDSELLRLRSRDSQCASVTGDHFSSSQLRQVHL